MCVYTLTSCCNGIVIYIMRLVIISYKSIRFGKVLTKKLTTQHHTMFSSLSCSAKSPVTTIQKLSKTPGTTSSLVAARTRTARVVRQAESGDEGVVTVAKEPKENDDVARGVADAVAAAEKAFEMDDATKEDDVSPSAVQQRAAAM